jgi:hypothetical protein
MQGGHVSLQSPSKCLRLGRRGSLRCASPAGPCFPLRHSGAPTLRVVPSWLRRSFSSETLRLRESTRPKTHHTLRHPDYESMACNSNFRGVGKPDLPSTKLHWNFNRNSIGLLEFSNASQFLSLSITQYH